MVLEHTTLTRGGRESTRPLPISGEVTPSAQTADPEP